MRIRLFSTFVLLFLFAVCVSAQTNLLPDQAGSWQAEGPAKTRSGAALFQGSGDVRTDGLREAGLTAEEGRNYVNGGEKLEVRLYRFKDTSGAYEFYTGVIAPDMQSGRLGDESAFGATHGVILVGNLVVLVIPANPASLTALVSALKAKADTTPFPPLRSYMPTHWRVFGTERYALGPVGFSNSMDALNLGEFKTLGKEISFQDDAETILARYQGEKGGGVLLLILYTTPQLAENRLPHLAQAIPASAKASGVTVERKASMLSIVFGTTIPMHAQAVRDEVNYQTEVTWNEPSTSATDP